jgi:hypothetical protein
VGLSISDQIPGNYDLLYANLFSNSGVFCQLFKCPYAKPDPFPNSQQYLAAVGPLDESTVRAAMEEVKHSDLEKWNKNEIGETVQKQRQHVKNLVMLTLDKVGRKIERFFKGKRPIL